MNLTIGLAEPVVIPPAEEESDQEMLGLYPQITWLQMIQDLQMIQGDDGPGVGWF